MTLDRHNHRELDWIAALRARIARQPAEVVPTARARHIPLGEKRPKQLGILIADDRGHTWIFGHLA